MLLRFGRVLRSIAAGNSTRAIIAKDCDLHMVKAGEYLRHAVRLGLISERRDDLTKEYCIEEEGLAAIEAIAELKRLELL